MTAIHIIATRPPESLYGTTDRKGIAPIHLSGGKAVPGIFDPGVDATE